VLVEELRESKEWDTFVNQAESSTFYHTLEWRRVIENSFSHRSLYLTIRDSDGEVVGLCPGFIVRSRRAAVYDSMPYSDYGGPVIASQCFDEASTALANSLRIICRDKRLWYAKISFMNDRAARVFESPQGYVEAGRGVVEIDLKRTTPENLWITSSFYRLRKRIRAIERDGLQAQEAVCMADLEDFYRLYNKNMRYIGASPYPRVFIENMWRMLYPRNFRIWLVGKNKRIGGIAVFKHKRTTYWAYAGIDRRFSGKYSLVPYLVWKEINKAKEEGCRYVSLGSTSTKASNVHHIQKMSFGGSFNQQKTVWHPYNCSGLILLHMRAKTLATWEKFSSFIPNKLANYARAFGGF
jgi:serine/alanine adding enzyme